VSIAGLVERARNDALPVDQQHAAFAELVRRFEESAFAWSLQQLHDPEEARDVCQDAFITAWLKLRQLKDPAAFAGWLKRIIVRKSLGVRQQSCRFGTALASTAPYQSGGSIATALRNLPEDQQRIVVMFYYLGYKLDEIASILNIPRGTAGKRLYSARINIRRRLPGAVREEFQQLRPSRRFLQQVREGLFDEYTGTYRFEKRPELTVTITRDGEQLVSDSNGQRTVLVSLKDGALIATAFDAEGRFQRDRRGRVTRFVYYEHGLRLGVAKKIWTARAPARALKAAAAAGAAP
jgi:RNA polymerase sigma-70 factor (ECF subfamily)